ncbi:MAG: hypothetical protein ACXVI9_08550 [Mucilaginibacter sp.]
MKYLILIMSILITGFKPTRHTSTHICGQNLDIDTSRYAILNFAQEGNYYFDKDVKATTLTIKEMEKIERLIDERISRYNEGEAVVYRKDSIDLKKRYPNALPYDHRIKNARKYYKQFLAVINTKGEKIIWANCFCSINNFPYWKKSSVLVMDGGICYFNLKINLTKGTTYELMINGDA